MPIEELYEWAIYSKIKNEKEKLARSKGHQRRR